MKSQTFRMTMFVALALLLVLMGCGGGNKAPDPAGVTIKINQASPISVQVGANQQFTTTITGSTDTSATWSIQEGASGGSFSQTTSGLYTAPGSAGTFHIIATSVADPTKTATATVNVTTAPVTNTAPTASFTVNPASGPQSTNFAVDASGSTDAQDAASALQVRWDWSNDGIWDSAYSTTKTANHTYAAPGTYTIKLEVKDTGGLLGTTTKTATVTAPGVNFTLTLDGTVDTSSGSTKASSFTSADLLDTSGSVAKTGTLSGSSATFDLAGLASGTYFVKINNLADDLVPVLIDSVSASGTAFVGTRLRDVLIGTKANPTYRIKTFSQGQASTAVVKYSNGATATPTRYAYATLFATASPRKVEIRSLGTGALLSSRNEGGEHSMLTWTFGSGNHGVSYGGVDSRCGCHGNLSSHPAAYTSIDISSGWCYKCHSGKTGTSSGMVDPAQ